MIAFWPRSPRHRALDYSGERLLWDRGFRDGLLRAMARIGLEVERVLGSPQDIEGAVAGEQYLCRPDPAASGIGATLMPEIRIGNQTSAWCPDPMGPFHFALEQGFDAFEWFEDKKVNPDGSSCGWDETDMDAAARAEIRRTGTAHGVASRSTHPGRQTRCTPKASTT